MGRNIIQVSLVVYFCVWLGLASGAWGQVTWYVNDNAAGAGTGDSWGDAFQSGYDYNGYS